MALCTVAAGCASCSRMKPAREEAAIGGAQDDHGCLIAAGYTWSEVRKDCIRLWEEGIRLEDVNDSLQSAFIVFSPDSSQVELFFSDSTQRNEILNRRTLPSGAHVWNVEDDDTKNVNQEPDGNWTITRRKSILFRTNR